MKNKTLFILTLFFVFVFYSCKTGNKDIANSENIVSQESTDVIAYYFYGKIRCATCIAVEKVTKEVIRRDYAENVIFQTIDREEDKNEELIKKYKVAGQTLLLVKGNEVINLTNMAFLLARNAPEEYETRLKSTIETML